MPPPRQSEAERGSEGGARAQRRRPADLLTLTVTLWVACDSPALYSTLCHTLYQHLCSLQSVARSTLHFEAVARRTPPPRRRYVTAMTWRGAGALFSISFSFPSFLPPPSSLLSLSLSLSLSLTIVYSIDL